MKQIYIKKPNFVRCLLTQAGMDEKIALTQKFIERKKMEYDVLVHELEMMETLK